MKKIKVAVNGYGVIGKRAADAIMLQRDMQLIGVCDVATDWRIKVTNTKDIPVYAFNGNTYEKMKLANIEVALWEDMLKVEGDELYYAYLVDNQAIVIPEIIDAIRALTGIEPSAANSINATNKVLFIYPNYFKRSYLV